MDGILNVYKPKGITSHDVVSRLRKILKTKKIGHAGTLDPNAEGVLPVCVGKATKVVEYLIDKDKKYRAELMLGITTDTQDITGQILEQKEVKWDKELIIDKINSFIGEIEQIPPMYSAIKIDGKKLYELARMGKTIEREKRKVIIYQINIITFNQENKKVMFDVSCSKGTYIRTLCNDIGAALGCGGCMGDLVRLKSGTFEIDHSFTLEQIEDSYTSGEIDTLLKPIDYIFENLPKVTVKDESIKWVLNGAQIYPKDILEKCNFENTHMIRIYNVQGEMLAIYKIAKDREIKLVPEKMFI